MSRAARRAGPAPSRRPRCRQLQAVAGDGSREVRLARAVSPVQHQQPGRPFRPTPRQPERPFEVLARLPTKPVPAWSEALEREVREPLAAHPPHREVTRRRRLLQHEHLREGRVGQPRAEPGVDLLGGPHAGEDGGQRRVEAMRDELHELLARPRRLRVAVEVVEHGERRRPQLLAEPLVGHLGVLGVRGAQAVEEVGDREEERGHAALDRAVGDRGGEVGLAAAGHPGQHQPALGSGREALCRSDRRRVALLGPAIAGTAARQQRLEAETPKRAEARVAQQPLPPRRVVLPPDAVAGHGAAERGILHVGGDAHEARTAAARARRGGLGECRVATPSCGG